MNAPPLMVNGIPLSIDVPIFDVIGDSLLKGKFWEEETVLKKSLPFLNYDSVVMDIGAHIGNHAVWWACYVKAVIAFEPFPLSFDYLERNASVNNLPIVPYNSCLGKGNKEHRKLVHGLNGNLGGNSFSKNGGTGDVAVFALDTFDFDQVDLLKLDVEGMELEVLEGAYETLSKFKPTLFIEVHETRGVAKGEVVEVLKPLGYVQGVNMFLHNITEYK
jgi:FkbM family methyltransferase